MSKKTKLDNRETLKNYFKNGTRPSEENFGSLIDSMINKADDGISKNLDDGLILAPEGESSNRTLSFFNKIGSEHPNWSIELMQGEGAGLAIAQPTGYEDEPDQTRMFFNQNGKIGVHTTEPETDFEVDGTLGVKSRVGTYKLSTVSANGQWHTVVDKLDGLNGYEVVAQVGLKDSGKHALLHAIALGTFGQFRIRRTQSWWGFLWWNRLAIRWEGSRNNYRLQLKTRSNYGKDVQIKYHITQLWGNEVKALFDPQETNQ